MADSDNLTYPTYEQIATLLSHLATNYSTMAENFVTIFYDTTPKEVTFKMYDKDGILQTFTMPNRAKDFNYIKNGEGNPEGRISAPKGTIYQDTLNGNLYVKKIYGGDPSVGWFVIDSSVETFMMGPGDPNSEYEAPLGTLYVDTSNFRLYVKTIDGGKSGWIIVTPPYDNRPIQNSPNAITSGAVYEAIGAISGDLPELIIDVADLKDRMTTVEGKVDTLENEMDTAQDDITNIQGDITNIQGDITNIQGDITDIQNILGDINTILQQINGEQV